MGVTIPCVAAGVILVPVDAKSHCFASTTAVGQRFRTQAQSLSVECILSVQAARAASFAPRRHISARHDAVIRRQGADEGALIVLLRLIVWCWQSHT